MNNISSYLVGIWLALASLPGYAQEQAAELAREPTVNVVWVAVFGLLFVGLCVWFIVAMILSERKAKATEHNAP